jgi:hypothetical protein
VISLFLVGWALAADEQQPDRAASIAEAHGLDDQVAAKLRSILNTGRLMGTGLPGPTTHPMTPTQCQDSRAQAGLTAAPEPDKLAVCGRPHMAPLYDPTTQQASEATACIDQYEFPGIPCEYPLIWVRASEAAGLCEAMGKRLCDAHEWEGACAGSMSAPDYRFDLVTPDQSASVRAMRAAHNDKHSPHKAWAYGPEFKRGVCAQASSKNDTCDGSDPAKCGSNTYPTGAFPGCTSALGVYDLHGNAAEHMNLPLSADQMASAGGPLGVTEMKGSWFIWDSYQAHDDWCRWRAPFWHGDKVRSDHSHRNYHLSFRCCADVGG